MPVFRGAQRRLAGIAAALTIACSSDSGGPDEPGTQRPADELTFLRLDQTAPPLEADSVSFWAFRGQSIEQKLYFLDAQGQRGDEYLSFKLEDESLLRYPDGTTFAAGDSVLITIEVSDPARILFELEPTGLSFSPSAPAALKIQYDQADDDFDDDGDQDGEDAEVETLLGIWRQESPGDLFVRLGSVQLEDEDEIEAELTGFSRYAIAY